MSSMGNPGLQPPGSTLNSLVPPWNLLVLAWNSLVPPWNSWVVRSGCQVSNVQRFGFPKIQEWYLGLESERIFSVGHLQVLLWQNPPKVGTTQFQGATNWFQAGTTKFQPSSKCWLFCILSLPKLSDIIGRWNVKEFFNYLVQKPYFTHIAVRWELFGSRVQLIGSWQKVTLITRKLDTLTKWYLMCHFIYCVWQRAVLTLAKGEINSGKGWV